MSKILPRETVMGPPVGWRPRDLTTREKLEIVVRQRGFEPDGITRLLPMEEGVQFDHVPALQRRVWDLETNDTVPPACSLENIVAVNKTTHATKTARHDIPEIAKTRRLERKRHAMERAETPLNGKSKLATVRDSRGQIGTRQDKPIREAVANKDSRRSKGVHSNVFNDNRGEQQRTVTNKREWPKRPFPKK